MIETKEFSYDLIYEQIKDFCVSKGITKKSFRLAVPRLVSQQNLVDNINLDEGHAFSINANHYAAIDLVKYLDEQYSFESNLLQLIQDYDRFYNYKQEEICFKIHAFFFINLSGLIQSVHVFEFNELQFGDAHMSLFEVNDSHVEDFERKVLDYYLEYFGQSLPEELQKPLSQLSNDELSLVRMITI